MNIFEIFSDVPRSRRSVRLVTGSREANNLAPSDTLLGMEQRLERANRQRDYDREHITVTGGEWVVRAMTEEELKAHFRR